MSSHIIAAGLVTLLLGACAQGGSEAQSVRKEANDDGSVEILTLMLVQIPEMKKSHLTVTGSFQCWYYGKFEKGQGAEDIEASPGAEYTSLKLASKMRLLGKKSANGAVFPLSPSDVVNDSKMRDIVLAAADRESKLVLDRAKFDAVTERLDQIEGVSDFSDVLHPCAAFTAHVDSAPTSLVGPQTGYTRHGRAIYFRTPPTGTQKLRDKLRAYRDARAAEAQAAQAGLGMGRAATYDCTILRGSHICKAYERHGCVVSQGAACTFAPDVQQGIGPLLPAKRIELPAEREARLLKMLRAEPETSI